MVSAEPFEPQSLARLSDWLSTNLPELGRLQSAVKLSGGQSNPTYCLFCGAGSCVLRRRPSGSQLPKAHLIERECTIMSVLGRTSVPVPAMLAYCKDEAVIGAQFFMMECVEGRIFWDPSLPGHSAAKRACLYDAMNAVIADTTAHKLARQ